ncbi:MAG: TolC family protein [Flavobacteriales bacterium]|nr:TolC family protein [Flavobacteriales bacterium]
MRTPATIIAATALALTTAAQGPMQLSMKQAMDLAAQQSYQVQYGSLEAQKAAARTKEFLAIGLPQINASGSLNNYLDVPTTVVPNFFGDDPPELEVQFGVPWNASGGVQLDQLIFDGSYLVGLKASRELKVQAEEDLERTVADARAQAARAYLGVLAAEEGATLVSESVPLLQKSLTEVSAMQEQGFMEDIDVDRLRIELSSAQDRQRAFQDQAKVARGYLLLVLGLSPDTPVQLTDDLQTLVDDPGEKALVDQPLNVNEHIDMQIANTYERLQVLNVKNERSAYLPKLRGFFNYSAQAQRQKFDFLEGGKWFPSSLWGLSLQVPIFSSGMRHYRVKQAQLGLDEARVNLRSIEQQLLTEHLNKQVAARSARDSYAVQRENMVLAKSVFERTSVKFSNGLASSFELTQEQSNYLTAQLNYMQKLVDMLTAQIDLRKALDLY